VPCGGEDCCLTGKLAPAVTQLHEHSKGTIHLSDAGDAVSVGLDVKLPTVGQKGHVAALLLRCHEETV